MGFRKLSEGPLTPGAPPYSLYSTVTKGIGFPPAVSVAAAILPISRPECA